MAIDRTILFGIFLLIIINFTFQPALAQINEAVIEPVNDTIIAKDIFQHKNDIIILNTTFSDSFPKNGFEEIFIESQNNFDKSLSILNVVATSMAILVGLITVIIALFSIIIMVAIACGFFKYRAWKVIIDKAESDAEIIENFRQNVENDVESTTKDNPEGFKSISSHTPSEEVMRYFDKLSSKIELLELLGGALKPEDFLSRGMNFYYREDYDSSLSVIEKGIESYSDDFDLWVAKGVILDKLERYQEALKSADIAINLDLNQYTAWCNRGVFLHKLGQYDEALSAYDKSLALAPEDPNTFFNIACCYSLMDNKGKMLEYLEKAITKDQAYKEQAKEDTDFKEYLDDEEFKNLTE